MRGICVRLNEKIRDRLSAVNLNDDKRLLKHSFLYTFLLGMAAHAFAFLNLQPSHDSLFEFFSESFNHSRQISLGRIFEPLYHKLTASSAVMPWSVGILSLCWIALSVFMVAKIFRLENKGALFLLSGVFATNATVIAMTATYMPWLGVDTMALLFSVLSVMFWHLYFQSSRLRYLVAGAFALMLSMGLYQSYVAVTITLIIIYSVLALLKKFPIRAVFKNGCAGIVMLIAGGGFYYAAMKVVCKIYNVSIMSSGYNTVANLWNNTETIKERIWHCYNIVLEFFFEEHISVYPGRILHIANFLLVLVCIAATIYIMIRKRVKWTGIVLTAVLIILLPAGMNVTRLLNSSTHDLTYYAFFMAYLIPLLLFKMIAEDKELFKARFGKWISYVIVFFVVFQNIQTANLVYVEKQIQYDSTMSLMTNVLRDIEDQEDYIEGETPVIFIGYPGDIMTSLPEKNKVYEIIGVEINAALTYDYETYFEIMQRNVLVEPSDGWQDLELVQGMPVYPQKGSVAKVGDAVVVKFSQGD